MPPGELQWLDDVAAESGGPVLVFGHHDVWPIDAPVKLVSGTGLPSAT